MASPPPHVAVLAFPFASHPNTLHALATLLASAAPHATFSFLSSARSTASLVRLPTPSNLSLHDVPEGCEEILHSLKQPASPGDADKVLSPFFAAFPGNCREGMRIAVRERGGAPVSCIVCDVLLVPLVADLAEEMGVPWVAFRDGGTSALLSHVYTDEIRVRIAIGQPGDRKLDFIPSLSAFQVSDLPEGLVDGSFHPCFSGFLHRMGTQLSRATVVAVNTCSALEGPVVADLSARFSRFFSVGPLNLLLPSHQPDAEASNRDRCLSWLDGRRPSSVVYVALGSTNFFYGDSRLTAMVEALESTGAPFLWSMKEEVQQWLPQGFLEHAGGLVLPWVPQAEVLRHAAVGAFVTHCGWNSVVESVAGGVPMVCMPCYGDQRLNARQVVEVWGIGAWVEVAAMSGDGLAVAVERVLGPEGEAMRERARKLGEKEKEATAEGGSSRENFKALVDMVCAKHL